MGSQMEVFKDSEGISHIIFDKSAMYDDSKMGQKLSDFEVLQFLGAYNNNNIISKVRSFRNDKIYVIKKIELNKIKNEKEKELCLKQMDTLKTINHPHLLKYYNYFKDENNNLYMVYEHMNNSDLNSFIKAHQILKKDVKEEEIWNILLQCLSGLAYLHQKDLAYLAIKSTNVFLNNEQNVKIGLLYDTPKLEDKNKNKKTDIVFIGKYFYKMCYAKFFDEKDKTWIDDIDVHQFDDDDYHETIYSKEILNIIGEMIKDDINQIKSAEELYNLVKSEYVKKYTRITSIKAVLTCLYSFTNFTKKFLETENYILSNKDRCHISLYFLKTIKAVKSGGDLIQCFEEFKRAIASENSKIDASKEVDPVYLLAFLFENIHKEGNKRIKTEVQEKSKEVPYIMKSIYKVEEEDDKTNKEQMIYNFNYYFKENVHSIISDYFFGFMKMKRNCMKCKTGTYSFSNFCIVPFDLTKSKKINQNNNQNNNQINDNDNDGTFDIIQGFNNDREDSKKDNPPYVFCDRCLTEQQHFEFNQYYSMGKNITIFFYRGKNYQSNKKIDFKEVLDIKKYTDVGESTPLYQLVGSINRVINDEKEEFIYFAKDPDKTNIWKSSFGDAPTSIAPIDLMQQYGQIIMLFYKEMNQNEN